MKMNKYTFLSQLLSGDVVTVLSAFENGTELTLAWLRLLCAASESEGRICGDTELRRAVALAAAFRVPVDSVYPILDVFFSLGLVSDDGDSILVNDETLLKAVAAVNERRVRACIRKQRQRHGSVTRKEKKEQTPPKEKERTKEIEITPVKEKREDMLSYACAQSADETWDGGCFSDTVPDPPDNVLFTMGGLLGKNVIKITDREMGDLLDELGLDGFNEYVPRVADFLIKSGCPKTRPHAELIREWYEMDHGKMHNA